MKTAWKVALAILTLAAPSLADGKSLEGASCETSSQCGGLKCIDERCRDVSALVHGELPSWNGTVGHRAMFGTGRGYGSVVIAADVAATVTEPLLMLATVASGGTQSSVLGVVCFVPVGFAGPLVHVAHGRFLPAVISFFAWTSLAGTTFVVGGLFGLAFENGFEFNSVAAWIAGLSFGAAGAAGLTALDAWMARPVEAEAEKKPPAFSFAPSIVPTRGGAIAAVSGIF